MKGRLILNSVAAPKIAPSDLWLKLTPIMLNQTEYFYCYLKWRGEKMYSKTIFARNAHTHFHAHSFVPVWGLPAHGHSEANWGIMLLAALSKYSAVSEWTLHATVEIELLSEAAERRFYSEHIRLYVFRVIWPLAKNCKMTLTSFSNFPWYSHWCVATLCLCHVRKPQTTSKNDVND